MWVRAEVVELRGDPEIAAVVGVVDHVVTIFSSSAAAVAV